MVVVRTVVCPDRDAGWTPVVSYGSSVVSVWVADTNTVVVIPYCNHVPHYSRLGGMGVESRWLTPPYQGPYADGGCSAVRSSCGSKYWSVVRLQFGCGNNNNTMSNNAFAEIENAVNEASQNNSSSSTDDDREDLPYARAVPTTVFGGAVERVIYMGRVTENGSGIVEQQTYEDGTQGDWGIVLEDPVVLKGSAYEGDEDEGVQYRIFDESHDDFSQNYDQDAELKSVDSNGMRESYNGTPVEEISADKMLVFIGGLSGQFITRNLDANGGTSAYVDEDGNNSRGLIEYPDDWGDGDNSMIGPSGLKPRVARYPQLRDDLAGEEIFIALKDVGGNRTEGEVGLMDDLGLDELGDDESLAPETIANAYIGRVRDQSAPDYDATLAWHDAPESVDDGPSGDFDIGGTDDDTADESSFTENTETFIDQVLGTMDEGDTVDDVFGDFSATVDSVRAKNTAEDELSLPNTTSSSDLADEINRRNSA